MFFEVSSFESMARTVRVSTYGNWVQEFDKAHRRGHKSDDVAISLSFLTNSNCLIGSLQQSARYQRSMCSRRSVLTVVASELQRLPSRPRPSNVLMAPTEPHSERRPGHAGKPEHLPHARGGARVVPGRRVGPAAGCGIVAAPTAVIRRNGTMHHACIWVKKRNRHG